MSTERVANAIKEYADSVPVPDGDMAEVLERAGAGVVAAPSRHRMRWLVPVGAAIAVVVAIGVAVLVPGQEKGPAPIGKSWLPDRIQAPKEPPRALPKDRAVGPGSVIYSRCGQRGKPATCKDYLITEDGTHYLIPGSSDRHGEQDHFATLSPDGRWLGVTRKGEYRLRDLNGGTTYRMPGEQLVAVAWSPDGRWLVVGRRGIGPDPDPVWRIDTRTGEARQVKAPFRVNRTDVIDVTRRGEVLLVVPAAYCTENDFFCMGESRPGELFEVALVDPDRGAEPMWTRKLDDAQMRDDETARLMRLTPDGRSLLIGLRTFVGFPDGKAKGSVSGDLLLFDLATGERTRRYDVKDGAVRHETIGPSDKGPMLAVPETSWDLVAHDGDGILLLGLKYRGTGEKPGPVDEQIDLVDPDTGSQRTLTRAAPDITLIAVRGSLVRQ